MKESDVEEIVRNHILKEYLPIGWKYTKINEKLKKKSEHGPDITLYNPKKGDYILIEVKKWSNTCAANHNSFYCLFGQLLSRINKTPSEIYSKRKKMIIAVPKEYTKLIAKKSKKMVGGWELFGKMTNLRIWSVDMKKKEITKYHWKYFLNDKGGMLRRNNL